MIFVTGATLTRCAGQEHYTIDVTIAGQTVPLKFERAEIELDFATREEARQAILGRLRSAAKEANATTFAQVRTAVQSKTFKV